MMITKIEARNKVKQFRSELSADKADQKTMAVIDKLYGLPEFQDESILYLYKSVNNEIETEKIIQDALRLGKTVAIPKVCGRNISFYRITYEEDLDFGYMVIPEPSPNPYKMVDTEEGIIIVPGLAFDIHKNRTGYGGGFYDRFLKTHPHLLKIGVAYDEQIFDELQTDDFDITMDMIITDKRIIR